jgi:hypothetical protein
MDKGKGRATDNSDWKEQVHHAWRESRKRAKADRSSWDYILSSGIAGGIAGSVVRSFYDTNTLGKDGNSTS